MNRYLLVTLIAVAAIFFSRAHRFSTVTPGTITEDHLDQVFSNIPDKKVLLYFWQPNSKPCEETTPMLEEVVASYSKKLYLVKIDTSLPGNKAIHDTYNISSIPTLVVVQKGKAVNQWVGPFRTKELMINFLRPSGAY